MPLVILSMWVFVWELRDHIQVLDVKNRINLDWGTSSVRVGTFRDLQGCNQISKLCKGSEGLAKATL